VPQQDPFAALRTQQVQEEDDPFAALRTQGLEAPDEDLSLWERLKAGHAREYGAFSDYIEGKQEELGVVERLGPVGNLGEGLETVAKIVAEAGMAGGNAMKELVAPRLSEDPKRQGPARVGMQLAKTAQFFTPQEGEFVSPAMHLAGEFTGVPAALRTAGRVGGALLHPMQTAERVADNPYSSMILGGLDATMGMSVMPGVVGRALAAGKPVPAAAAESLGQLGSSPVRGLLNAAPDAPPQPSSLGQLGTSLAEPGGLIAGSERAALAAGREAPAGLLSEPSSVLGQTSRRVRDRIRELGVEREAAEAPYRGLPTRLKVVDDELALIDDEIAALMEGQTGEFVAGGRQVRGPGGRILHEGSAPEGVRLHPLQEGQIPGARVRPPLVVEANRPPWQVSEAWERVASVVEERGIPRDVQGRYVAAAIGKTMPTTPAEARTAVEALRAGNQGLRVPGAQEIRAAVRSLRASGEMAQGTEVVAAAGRRPPPAFRTRERVGPRTLTSVDLAEREVAAAAQQAAEAAARRPPPAFRTRERTQPRERSPIEKIEAVFDDTMPQEILEGAPADAIFVQDLIPWSIAGVGQRTKQGVRDWVTWGSNWADFDYVNFGMGQSIREGVALHGTRFKAAVDALKPVEKMLRKNKDFERQVANAMLTGVETGVPVVDDAVRVINQEMATLYALEGNQGAIGFVENYVPVIRRLQGYGSGQQVPSDIQRFAALRVMNPHRKAGPNAASRQRYVERIIEKGEVNLADLVRLRLYTGYRDVSLNPVLEMAERYLLASNEITSLLPARNQTMAHAIEAVRLGTYGPKRTQRLVKAIEDVRDLGKMEPLTIVQQDSMSLYLPKFTGKQGFPDLEVRVRNFLVSRGLLSADVGLNGTSKMASRLTRNTLTGLIGFQTRTAVKQASQLQNTVLDVGVLPTALGALMVPAAAVERVGARGINVGLRAVGSSKRVPLLKAPHELLGSVRGEVDMLALRELQGRWGKIYSGAAFAQLEAAEHFVRGSSYWAGVISHGIRGATRTGERELLSGAVARNRLFVRDAAGKLRYNKAGAFEHGVATATRTQFHYGAAAESPLFAAMGSVGTMANGLTTFGRKQAAFTITQLAERPIVAGARLGKAAKGVAKGEAGVGMKELAHELSRLPQEVMPLARFYASFGAMMEVAEIVGVNLDDVTGFGPITGMWRFGQPFAVFEPIIKGAELISAWTSDDATIDEEMQALVDFSESAMVYQAVPVSAVRTWAEFYRDQFVNPGIRGQTRAASATDKWQLGNVPLARHAASGGGETMVLGETGTSRGTTINESFLRAMIGEPLAFATQREMMSELGRIQGEFDSVRDAGIARAREMVLKGLTDKDPAGVEQGLKLLVGYNVDITKTFNAPLIKQIEGMSDDEEMWGWFRLLQLRGLMQEAARAAPGRE
jgi:hypothetical protein